MDWAGRTEDQGNAGETADSFFHPSGPSKFGYLIQRKGLTLLQKLASGADRTPFHPVNPGVSARFNSKLRLQRRVAERPLTVRYGHWSPKKGRVYPRACRPARPDVALLQGFVERHRC